MLWLIILLCTTYVRKIEGQLVRYNAACSVPLCGINSCSSQQCYSFQTVNDANICAPLVTCSLLDPCINNSGNLECSTNNSVCIQNTCCPQAICLPLALTTLCTNITSSSAATST
ncbi:unnamed protein product, partial [Didymodactylos carnosus]